MFHLTLATGKAISFERVESISVCALVISCNQFDTISNLEVVSICVNYVNCKVAAPLTFQPEETEQEACRNVIVLVLMVHHLGIFDVYYLNVTELGI